MDRRWSMAMAVLALVAGPAIAQDDADNTDGFYLGGGIGDFSADIDSADQIDEADVNFDSDEDATKVFGGWRFNRFVAFQLDYTDFGESRAAVNELPIRGDTKGLAPSVVGTLPVGPIELFAKGGVIFYDVDIDMPGSDVVESSGEDLLAGVGIGFTAFDRLNLKAEYERYDIDELDNSDAVWLSAEWRF